MTFARTADSAPARWRAWLVVVALTLALHALVLGLVPIGLGEGSSGGVRPAMQVRQIVRAPPQAEPAVARGAPRAAPAPRAQARPRMAQAEAAPAETPAAPLAQAQAADAALPPDAAASAVAAAEPEPAMPSAAELAGATSPGTTAATDAGGRSVPVFATRLPPPVQLRFELRRGVLRGEGELNWRPREDGYALAMTGTAFGMPLISWLSQGAFDGAGIAPERFLDRRRARDQRAANFQRDIGRITYSGPPIGYPLVPGAQDRLSWMVQLPAIVDAAPDAFGPGAQIPIFVTGARGDADLWTFSVEGREALELPAGRVENALRLLRQPRKPYDTRVEVWLDPQRHHLPVRVWLVQAGTQEGNEFLLSGLTFGP